MGIGSVTSSNSMSSMQMITAASTDPKIKSIQNEITDAKQQMQKLSSKEDLSTSEKADERKKLQKEISSLNTELKQYQEELSRSQKREIRLAELQEDQNPDEEETAESSLQSEKTSLAETDEKKLPADEQQTGHQGTVIVRNSDGTVIKKEELGQDRKPGVDPNTNQTDETKDDIVEEETKATSDDMVTDSTLSYKEMHSIVSADSSLHLANHQGTVIARTTDGIAILKGEINLDKQHDENTDKKQAELEKMEKREERAMAFQFSILGEANNTMKSAAENDMTGTKNTTPINRINNAFINALNVSQEEDQTAYQFHVSIV